MYFISSPGPCQEEIHILQYYRFASKDAETKKETRPIVVSLFLPRVDEKDMPIANLPFSPNASPTKWIAFGSEEQQNE